MPDTSSGVITDSSVLVAPTSTFTNASVSPVQTGTISISPSSSPATATSATQQIIDTSGLIAQYEQRIRALMSDKDKAINERNQAINQLTDLQQQLTSLQEQTQSSLTGAANAAQQAIDNQKALQIKLTAMEGEALRASTLLERPHLAPYAQFIPASSDPEKVKAAVDTLEEIRRNDLARNGVNAQQPGNTPMQQPGQPTLNPLNMYQGRQNMAPLTFGSNPAAMNPVAAGQNYTADPLAAIQQLFDDARKSGSQADFDSAVKQSQVYAQAAINQQLGRSS